MPDIRRERKEAAESLTEKKKILRESSFNMTRGGGGMKILRGGSENFRHPKEGL